MIRINLLFALNTIFAVLIFSVLLFAQQSIEYRGVDIGTFGAESYATGINSKGHIVGYSRTSGSNDWQGFIWIDSVLTNLGSLGGNGTTAPSSINDSDEVTGSSYISAILNDGGGQIRAFRWKNGVMTNEGTLGGVLSRGDAINNSGMIVGESAINDTLSYAGFKSLYGSMQNLNIDPQNRVRATSINNSGLITGWKDVTGGGIDGWLLDGGITILGSLGGGSTFPNDINENGDIVGRSSTSSLFQHAFLWQNGVMIDLGVIPPANFSEAYSVNNSGEIVGGSAEINGGMPAFIYKDGEMKKLNDLIDPSSGWNLLSARCINDNGWIVGNGILNGQKRAFLLVPEEFKITNPVPNDLWIAGETDTIKWSGGESGQLLDIEYSIDNGNTYLVIKLGVLASGSSYLWKVPNSVLSKKVKIKLTDVVDTLFSVTSGTFRIKPYLLTRNTNTGDYDAYSKFRDPYAFGNDSASVWPIECWQNFDYYGTDPFTGFNYLAGVPIWLLLQTSSSDHPDWISWVRTFGVSACYYNTSFPPVYSTTALMKWIDYSDGWGGSCFGMSTSNILLFKNNDAFQSNYPSFPTSDPLQILPNDSVRTVINELYTHQFGNEHLTYRRTVGLLKTPNQTLHEIRTMLLDDDPLVRTLSIVSNDPTNPGGHSIMAYKLEQDTTLANLWYVFTYDNAYPENLDSAIIVVDTLANTWTPIYAWTNWGGTKWFYLRDPAITYFVTPSLPKNQHTTSPFILGENELQILNTRKASIRITDQQGNASGYMNGVLLSDIPGSIPNIIENGSSGPPIGYDLLTANYSVQLSECENTHAFVSFYTENKTFKIFRNDAEFSDNDRYFFDGGVSIANPDQHTKNVKLLNIINETTHEKAFFINEVELANSDSVKIINPDDNSLDLISYGSAKEYQIELNYASQSGLGRFQNNTVQLTQNTTHNLVPNWLDLTNSQLTIYVDEGNDGTIDDTLYIANTVDVEYEGNLLTPNEYNLAQNFPNPFNPTTTIRYSIPQRSNVSLKVYDVLGNEIATLVNEEKVSGVYTATFDASTLASGMYLYRLQAGNFVETKKMILLR